MNINTGHERESNYKRGYKYGKRLKVCKFVTDGKSKVEIEGIEVGKEKKVELFIVARIDGKDVPIKKLQMKCPTITVIGNVSNIENNTSDLKINGDLGYITSNSGNTVIKGDCKGSVVTNTGILSVKGNISGGVEINTGNVSM